MRLTPEEVKALVTACKSCFGSTAQIWLFGSRVDESASGGDIDLYIETALSENIVSHTIAFREQIWPCFGDQKIDIVVHRQNEPYQAIHEMAKTTGIKLL